MAEAACDRAERRTSGLRRYGNRERTHADELARPSVPDDRDSWIESRRQRSGGVGRCVEGRGGLVELRVVVVLLASSPQLRAVGVAQRRARERTELRNELLARVRTQLRKKRYSDKLRHNVQLSLEMAITDPLTGLHNRRYMASHLDTLMKSACPAKPVSFLIMDIDYFKAVNDTHGHVAGDVVLQSAVGVLQVHMRVHDIFGRLGGEEFSALATDYAAGLPA